MDFNICPKCEVSGSNVVEEPVEDNGKVIMMRRCVLCSEMWDSLSILNKLYPPKLSPEIFLVSQKRRSIPTKDFCPKCKNNEYTKRRNIYHGVKFVEVYHCLSCGCCWDSYNTLDILYPPSDIDQKNKGSDKK